MISVKHSSAALAALVACGLSLGADAAPPSSGQWKGGVPAGPSMIPVTLTIAAADRGLLQVGAPANCRLALAFVAERPDGLVYRLDSQIGGRFCDGLHGGEALLQLAGDGTMLGLMRSQHMSQRIVKLRDPSVW